MKNEKRDLTAASILRKQFTWKGEVGISHISKPDIDRIISAMQEYQITRNQALTTLLSESRISYEMLKEDCGKFQFELAECKARIAHDLEAIRRLEDERDELQNKYDHVFISCEARQKDCENAWKDVCALTEEVEFLRKENHQLRGDNTDLINALDNKNPAQS